MKKLLNIIIFLCLATFSQNNQKLLKSIVFGAENTKNSINRTILDVNDNIYIAGNFTFFSNFLDNTQNNPIFSIGNADAFVAKYDKELNILWKTIIGGIENDNILDISKNSNGDIVAVGYYNNEITVNGITYNVSLSGRAEFFTACLDQENGKIKWFKNFPNSYSNYGDVAETAKVNKINENNILITLNTSVGSYYLLRFIIIDNNGVVLKEKKIIELGYSAFRNTKVDKENNIYVSGFFSGTNVDFDLTDSENLQSSGNKNNAILIKYNSNFDLKWVLNFENNNSTVGDCFDMEINEKDEEIYLSMVHGGITNINPNGNEILISPYQTSNAGAILVYNKNGLLKKYYNQTGHGFDVGTGYIYDININENKNKVSFTGIVHDNLPNLDFTEKIKIDKSNNNFYSIIYDIKNGELNPREFIQYNIFKTSNLGLNAFTNINNENIIVLSGRAGNGDVFYNDNRLQNGVFGTSNSFIATFEPLTLSNNKNLIESLDILPNPVVDFFTININDGYKYSLLYNINGKFIIKSKSKKIDIKFLKRGVYVCKVYTEMGVFYKKIIKK